MTILNQATPLLGISLGVTIASIVFALGFSMLGVLVGHYVVRMK